MVAIQLAFPIRRLRGKELGLAIGTAIVSIFTNIRIGFIAGLAVTTIIRWMDGWKNK